MSSPDYRTRLYARYRDLKEHGSGPKDPRTPYLKKLVRRHFPKGRDAAILELACGDGALLRCLADAGYTDVHGVDRSPEQVRRSDELNTTRVEHEDVFDALAKLPHESRDVIVSVDLVEHLQKDEVLRLAEETLRVLRPGGRWILHTVNGESPFFGRVRYGDFTHETVFTLGSIRQVLMAVGFTSVHGYEDTPTVHGIKSFARAAAWQFFRAGMQAMLASETGAWRGAILSQNLVAVAIK